MSIKEVKEMKEVVTQLILTCDICGVENPIYHSNCDICRRDICSKCVGHREDRFEDYDIVWCKKCWEIGKKYRPKIDELEKEIETIERRWQYECTKKTIGIKQ